MKYIFDFDDVLFNNTKQFKVHIFNTLAKNGVPEAEAKAYYLEVREKEFSLRDFIETLFKRYNLSEDKNKIYEEIMLKSPEFINIRLLEQVKKIGKENCFIITNGEQEFNQDKITYTGIGNLFNQIYIVPGSKKEIIEQICAQHTEEKILFIDDKQKFIEDIDLAKCPNLKTILWPDQKSLLLL